LGDEVNEALTVAATEEVNDNSFLKLILPKADVNYKDGYALSLAIKNSLPQHVHLFLEKRPNSTAFDNAFTSAINHRQNSEQLRYCRMLLEASPAGDSAPAALVKAVHAGKNDLCNLMLQYNASANFDGGSAVVAAVKTQNMELLTSLVQNSDSPLSEESLEAAFEAALAVDNT
jgi:hypothetical protein